jgi:predicted DNA binding protein
VVFCKAKDGFLIGQILESSRYGALYNPEILHIKPWVIDGEKGVETFVLGSWKRKNLVRIANVLKENHCGRMIFIKRKEVRDFFMINVMPKMTKKQRKALELAIKYGYYDIPKKVSIKNLAEMMKLSSATYQAHLRKAQKKAIPYISGGADSSI